MKTKKPEKKALKKLPKTKDGLMIVIGQVKASVKPKKPRGRNDKT